MRCGLLGRKLGHSYSPQIHGCLGDYSYTLYEKEPQELADFLMSGDFTGLNVTIPYKKDVIPYCSQLTPCAKKLGAVNTIVRQPDGTLIGHNTDYFGFSSMVERSGLDLREKEVLVLGSGGAAVTVLAVLEELGAKGVVISRTGSDNYDNLYLHKNAAAIVNATPVGMYPNVDDSPLDLSIFPKLEGVLDLVYNPARTSLLCQAESLGIVAQNGLWMLVAQAKESAQWFTNSSIPDSIIPKIHNMLQKQMENIILLGMPGCGKSTVGKNLAMHLGKTFFDADSEIEKEAGMPIPEIFSLHGEDTFRQLETNVLRRLGKQSGLVIATGGGCVTRSENYLPLHRNGRLIWLQRDVNKLPTDGRPLSQIGKLADMYAVRKPLYQQFSDITICNDTSVEEAVDSILTALDLEA